ncbi:MAG TPA: N-acetylmuramoyl-L-alanine amidase [Puia sp.]|jgi:N-acetylmuramoyl-L-alanine amidase|nr:N-acetylmuramoyl-L-alanine amidase [Puia sp.]
MLRSVTVFIFFFFILSSLSSYQNSDLPRQRAPRIRTLVIDPGHGGQFHGTRGLISSEEDVTLEISLKLGDAIKKNFPDIKVVFTRTTDASVNNATTLKDDLHARAQIANQARGDLFISIHCNSTRQPPGGYYERRVVGHKRKLEYVGRGKKRRKKWVNAPIYKSYWVKNMRVGTETYIWKAGKQDNKTDAISERDESGEDVTDSTDESFDMSSPEARMRAQLYEKKFFDNSALFASLVEQSFAAAGRQSYGVKQRDVGIQVLQATGMPSVLIEVGFLSNKEEEEYLNSNNGQNEVVQNILDAFKRYKEQLEGSPDTIQAAPADADKQ